jgi:hypothetical protein
MGKNIISKMLESVLFHVSDEELKKIISSCFLTGGAVAKIYFDPTLRRPTIRLIEPENFIIDPNATAIETAEQVSHIFEIDQFQLEELQRNKIYLDVDLIPNSDKITPLLIYSNAFKFFIF